MKFSWNGKWKTVSNHLNNYVKVTVHLKVCFQFSDCNFVNTHQTPTTYISMESLCNYLNDGEVCIKLKFIFCENLNFNIVICSNVNIKHPRLLTEGSLYS